MGVDLSQRLFPDSLWELFAPLLPPFTPVRRAARPRRVTSGPLITAIAYVLTSGGCRRHLTETFGVSSSDGASPVHRVDLGGNVTSAG